MQNWLSPKFNTGNILPEIESVLRQFDYGGLTNQDDPVNQLARNIMGDDSRHMKLFAKRYTNIYQFKAEGRQFYLCDDEIKSNFEISRQVCILAAAKSLPLEFEITTNNYFINNYLKSVEVMGNCDVRVKESDEYEVYKSLLLSVLPHCERFSTHSCPVAFFSFPQDNILGYHIPGRQIAPDEVASAVSLLQRFP
jgi:hypothetical protein